MHRCKCGSREEPELRHHSVTRNATSVKTKAGKPATLTVQEFMILAGKIESTCVNFKLSARLLPTITATVTITVTDRLTVIR
jgi:hypothetical protein